MMTSKPTLIIPSETQLREFDAKLLLGCVAAEREYPVIIGSQTHIHLNISALPKGIYFAKDLQASKVRILDILEKLGSCIVAWDEEGLITYSPEVYYQRRISPKALSHTTLLFAWGKEYESLVKGFPGYKDTPVYVTGNPRLDLLRPELRLYFEEETNRIRERFGKFILVNTNFGTLNHFVENLTSQKPAEITRASSEINKYWSERNVYRTALFDHFRHLLPQLSKVLPEYTIILRPHPAENHEPWRMAASDYHNIQVIHEGNVIPWIMAAQVLIHNSCTTGIEAYLVGTPAIAYQPIVSDRFDHQLPNALGHQAFSFSELENALRDILNKKTNSRDDSQQETVAHNHMAALDGSLASDRIMDVIEENERLLTLARPGSLKKYLSGWFQSQYRASKKRWKSQFSGNKNSADYQQHRFPGISLEEVQVRLSRFQQLLDRFHGLTVKEVSQYIFSLHRQG
ncbi:MAG: hypothetical protein MRJ96_16935 [Nitrospirales bacterium]|nr:hypothetical protein [Nitrospira sp.]MDR4503131.1 hypothetical protein [Nitrospirales bacterium]